MASYNKPLSVFLISSFLSLITQLATINGRITAPLIHRNSPASPFYNASQTPLERFRNSLELSRQRHAYNTYLRSISPDDVKSTISTFGVEYIMEIRIGSPQQPVFLIPDTGSYLTWTQCQPCISCYAQRDPIYDPRRSSAFLGIPFTAPQCQYIYKHSSGPNGVCYYEEAYLDGSFTKGLLAADVFTLDDTNQIPVQFPNVVFGCGRNNGGNFDGGGGGIAGLGDHPLSLVQRLGGGKFYYCLEPPQFTTNPSIIIFGSVVTGPDVVTTPIIKKGEEPFYYITLESVTVGTQRIPAEGDEAVEGNIIIDSGSLLTYLPPNLYRAVNVAVKTAIQYPALTNPPAGYPLCWNIPDTGNLGTLPTITANFRGADLAFPVGGIVISPTAGVLCLSIVPDHTAQIGSLAHYGYIVAHDLNAKALSFKPANCQTLF